jgi:putative endonuclease
VTRSRRSAENKGTAPSAAPKEPNVRHERGREAEQLAAQALIANGFRLLWRNLRIGSLEIDLVAQKGDLVVVVEVRARGPGAFEKPLASLTRSKRRTLLRATRALWKGRLERRRDVQRLRIDIAAVTRDRAGNSSLEWIAGALTGDDG